MKSRVAGMAAVAAFVFAPTAVSADGYRGVAREYVAPSNWSGLYLGAGLGFGWSEVDGSYVLPPPDHHNSSDTNGWFDSRLGFQWQFSKIVLGVEGTYLGRLDSSWASSTSPSSDCLASVPNRFCESRFRDVWGAGGKVGLALGHTLIYGTGGWATTDIATRDRVATTGVVNVSEANRYRHDGWYAGVGADWIVSKFWSSDVIIGVEYRHYDFDSVRHFPSAPGTPAPIVVNGDTRDVSAALDVVSARLTFKFGARDEIRPLK